MHFGIVEKLKEKGKSEDEIQEYLKEEGILKDVNRVASATLNLSTEPPKTNFFEKIKKKIFRSRSEKGIKPKYRNFEKRVLIDLNDNRIKKYYSDTFKKELYQYCAELFNDIIRLKFQKISESFNNQVEGYANELKTDEFVKVYFVNVFREVVGVDLMGSKLVDNVDNLPKRKKYFQYLKDRQNQLVSSLDNYTILIDSYLEGNENFIRQKLLQDCKIIDDIIEFEYRYRFIIALNKEYSIEEASEEIINEKYFKIFTDFPELFSSVEVIVFTFNKIDCFDKYHSANISSLYYALFERRLISKNKTEFQRYVSKIHNIEFGKIREDKTTGHTPHRKRINQFLAEIDVQFPSINR